MKKLFGIFSATILLIVMSFTLVACNDGDELHKGTPVEWTDYLEEVADIMVSNIKTEGVLAVESNGNAIIKGEKFNIYFGLNYNFTDVDRSALIMTITKNQNNNLFSIKADNVNTYIDIAKTEYLQDAKLKLEETSMFSWLSAEAKEVNRANSKSVFREIFLGLGKRIFNGVNVNQDKTIYSFNIDEESQRDIIKSLLDILFMADDNVAKIFLNIIGITDADQIYDVMPNVGGNINFHIKNNKIERVDATNLTIDDTNSDLKLEFKTDNKENIEILDKIPTDDSGYKVTKVGCSQIKGSVSLFTSNGNKRAVKYDLELNVNLDIMQLIYNDYDLSKLKDDNYFHLRLTHKCDDYCTEFCRSKFANAQGAVLDVAFSPKHFGTHNLYINFNIMNVISEQYRANKGKYYASMTDNILPTYCLLTYSPSMLEEKEYITDCFIKLYISLLGVENDTVSFKTQSIKDKFNDSAFATIISNDYFKSEEYDNDAIQIKITDNIYGQNDEYDIYKKTIYIIDDDVAELKSYKAKLLDWAKEYNVLGWETEPLKSAKEYNNSSIVYEINNVYSANGTEILHGADDSGNYVPFSDTEAKNLVGNTIKLSYIDYAKNTVNNYFAEIVEVVNIDFGNTSSVQDVVVKIKCPNSLDYLWGLGDTTADLLNRLFDYSGEFYEKITIKMKLTKEIEGSFKLIIADQTQEYEIVYKTKFPQFLLGTAMLTYTNGYTKEVEVQADSKDLLKESTFVGYNYSIINWGKIEVEYNALGRKINKKFNIKVPDDFEFIYKPYNGVINETCFITSYTTLNAIYSKENGEEKKVKVKLGLQDIYINNISLDKESAYWGHYKSFSSKEVVFYKSNEYSAEIRKNGYVSDKFIINIQSRAEQRPEYKFESSSAFDGVQLVDKECYINGKILNKQHGTTDDEQYKLKVNVNVGIPNGSTIVYNKADEASYDLELSVDKLVSTSGELNITLPSMIIKPPVVGVKLTLHQKGIYRVNIVLNYTIIYQVNFSVV